MSTKPGWRVRHRNNTSDGILDTNYINPYAAPYPLIINGHYSAANVGTVEEMTDVVTSNFQTRKANGEIINTPMQHHKFNLNFASMVVTDAAYSPPSAVGIVGTYTGQLFSIWDSPTGARQYTDGRAFYLRGHEMVTNNGDLVLHKAAVQARTNVNPTLVQSLVTLAELDKTVDLIAKTAKTIAKTVRQIRRGRNLDEIYFIVNGIGKGRASRVDQLPVIAGSRWLEARYGWMPLLYDLQGFLKAARNVREKNPRYTARGWGSKEVNDIYSLDLSVGASGTIHFAVDTTEIVSARAYVLYEADLKYQPVRDFGFTELPLAAWELVPFSFIVDWFVPIGQWLEAITPKVGIRILAEGTTLTTERYVNRIVSGHSDPTVGEVKARYTGHVGSVDSYSYYSKVRTPGLARPLLRPYIDVKLNVKRATDAIALLVTAGSDLHKSLRR